ncbi:MAG: NAD-dependent epimerase/dehydratase family protein [Thermoplasmata archaeon]|nr:NAD-dependent epimerase/dehydratase family protein [Thermoplasmata archaeon]
MKVLILGADGYLGHSLMLYLAARKHEVFGVDNFMRRSWVKTMGGISALPIAEHPHRMSAFNSVYVYEPYFWTIDVSEYDQISHVLEMVQPDAIVHLAECPSAPYSMIDAHKAMFVMRNNVIGTMALIHAIKEKSPNSHLVKLGTMGEYGTPNLDIPEGFFEVEYRDRQDILPFPRQAGSWYHWSKVHDSNNIMWACEVWGLRSTDIMQGVVYGTRIPEMMSDVGDYVIPVLRTRLDFDEAFGTAINRFVCQAVIGHPITVYGDIGKQTRGFLPLVDSMQCLTLAIENPPKTGEYRVLNQFEETYSILALAEKVQEVAGEFSLDVEIAHLETPRVEEQEHYYKPDHEHLLKLGYKPTSDMDSVLREMFADLLEYQHEIKAYEKVLVPRIFWSGEEREAEWLK